VDLDAAKQGQQAPPPGGDRAGPRASSGQQQRRLPGAAGAAIASRCDWPPERAVDRLGAAGGSSSTSRQGRPVASVFKRPAAGWPKAFGQPQSAQPCRIFFVSSSIRRRSCRGCRCGGPAAVAAAAGARPRCPLPEHGPSWGSNRLIGPTVQAGCSCPPRWIRAAATRSRARSCRGDTSSQAVAPRPGTWTPRSPGSGEGPLRVGHRQADLADLATHLLDCEVVFRCDAGMKRLAPKEVEDLGLAGGYSWH